MRVIIGKDGVSVKTVNDKKALTKRKTQGLNNKKSARLKMAKPKKLKKQQINFMRNQHILAGNAMYGFSFKSKKALGKKIDGAKKTVDLAKKPVNLARQQFYSQADKSDDSGVKATRLGAQIQEYGARGTKAAAKTAVKTGKETAKLAKRVYRKIHKPTSAELRRKLRKSVNHNIKAEAKYLAKRAAKNGTKAVGKATAKAAKTTAKTTANAAKQAARVAARAARAAAKAVASAVTKIAGLIAETMPYSLIIIAAVLLIVILALMVGSFFSSAGGSVAGGGAWLVDDSKTEPPEEIYEGYKEYVEQAKEVMQTQAKNALKDKVKSFCDSDTAEPRKIIQYIAKNRNVTYYPASGADSAINSFIDTFGTEDYADYLSLLFVLMTREKQQADGVTDAEIYDFDFQKSDFEEFMRTVNENSCRWGDTFVYKTAVETSPVACPNQNCKTRYIAGCKCSSYTDDDGKVHEYCGGHPYCPVNHTKLAVKLYTVKDYYGKDYPEIYNFTANEKARYNASKAIIQGLLDYWEGE